MPGFTFSQRAAQIDADPPVFGNRHHVIEQVIIQPQGPFHEDQNRLHRCLLQGNRPGLIDSQNVGAGIHANDDLSFPQAADDFLLDETLLLLQCSSQIGRTFQGFGTGRDRDELHGIMTVTEGIR